MFTSVLMALAAVPASPPTGNLVYLTCATQRRESAVSWQLTLNEQAGTVDVSSTANSGSGPDRMAATFTADTVIFLGFTLSRVDLTISRHVYLGGIDLGVETGQCQLVKQPTRAF